LRRLVVRDGRVVVDRTGTLPGRGAYVCNASCACRAVQRRAFARAFRRAVSVDDDLVESVGE
jgi:predicted RNA-binding protein YlxR (DUF448 family)